MAALAAGVPGVAGAHWTAPAVWAGPDRLDPVASVCAPAPGTGTLGRGPSGAVTAIGTCGSVDPFRPAVTLATARTLSAAPASACGTGWPEESARGTGWPHASPQPGGMAGLRTGSPSRHDVSCGLSGRSGAVSLARDFARAAVRDWGLPELCDDVTFVVSELVTNALRHGLAGAPGRVAPACAATGGGWPAAPIGLRLMLRPSDLICMVADPGAGVPERSDPGWYAEGGRGLHVVESCSDQWGWDRIADGGKVVWAAFCR